MPSLRSHAVRGAARQADRGLAALRRAVIFARAELTALTALLMVALSVLAFVELADDMTEADGQAFDQAVLDYVRPGPSPADPVGPWWLEEAAIDLTSLGGIAVLGLFAAIVTLYLLMRKKRLSALLLVAGLAGGVGLSEGLKAVFERTRPPAQFQAVETLNASFPSGHALLSAVFYLSIAVMLTRAFPRRRFKLYVLGVAVTLTVLVGLTRIYLAAHWASDVLAGWCVGAAWALVLWLIAYAVERRERARAGGVMDAPST